jgi:Gas vesicle synthesis protein GvpL/GvpF
VRLVPTDSPGRGRLAAAVSGVPLTDFGEAALRRHLEDLGWLEATAWAHHQVIEAVAAGQPVVPMRLATLYRDDAGVAAMLTRRHADLTAALDRVTGRAEWGVKLFGSPAGPAAAGPPGGPAAAAGGGGPGAAYLRRRQQKLTAAEQARRAEAAAAEAVHAALSQHAAGAQLRPPQARELTGEADTMLLNGTYLVDDDHSDALAGCARQAAGRFPGVRLVLTGPWPAYSFATVAGDSPPAERDTGAGGAG